MRRFQVLCEENDELPFVIQVADSNVLLAMAQHDSRQVPSETASPSVLLLGWFFGWCGGVPSACCWERACQRRGFLMPLGPGLHHDQLNPS